MNHPIPKVVEETAGAEYAFDIYSRLLRERIVILGTQLDEQVANIVVAQLLFLETEDPEKTINLYINTPGGDAYAGLAIYDTMRYVKPDVSTTCVGMAMGMGAVLLCGGAAGKRFGLPNSKVVLHQGVEEFSGSPADADIHANELIEVRKRVCSIVSEHSGRSVEEVERDMDRDRFMEPEEARDYGIIDSVVMTPAPV
jgi:ATP-dependent Clp protease, protease subunit